MKLLLILSMPVVAAMTMAVSCGHSVPAPTTTPSPTPISTPVPHAPRPSTAAPTLPPTPVPTPNPSALAIRPCRAQDLVVQRGGLSIASMHRIQFFGVANVSNDTCRVHGAPAVQLLDVGGNSIGSGTSCNRDFTSLKECQNTVAVLDPGPTLGPYAASFTITWAEPSVFGESCDGETANVAIDLPDDGGRIALNGVGVPSCARLGVSEFAPATTSAPDP